MKLIDTVGGAVAVRHARAMPLLPHWTDWTFITPYSSETW